MKKPNIPLQEVGVIFPPFSLSSPRISNQEEDLTTVPY